MKVVEEKRDLFSVSEDYYLAHCISADFGMGKGIVVEFNKRFDMKKKLISKYKNFLSIWDAKVPKGYCILEGRVLNLITKRNYWQKPTYETVENSLNVMKKICEKENIKKIAMPTIAAGLDGLEWSKVRMLINKVFEETDIEVLVCIK